VSVAKCRPVRFPAYYPRLCLARVLPCSHQTESRPVQMYAWKLLKCNCCSAEQIGIPRPYAVVSARGCSLIGLADSEWSVRSLPALALSLDSFLIRPGEGFGIGRKGSRDQRVAVEYQIDLDGMRHEPDEAGHFAPLLAQSPECRRLVFDHRVSSQRGAQSLEYGEPAWETI